MTKKKNQLGNKSKVTDHFDEIVAAEGLLRGLEAGRRHQRDGVHTRLDVVAAVRVDAAVDVDIVVDGVVVVVAVPVMMVVVVVVELVVGGLERNLFEHFRLPVAFRLVLLGQDRVVVHLT